LFALREPRDCERSEQFYVAFYRYNIFMYYVYILQSTKDKSLYIGYSPDLKNRLVKHNIRQVTSTKDKTPRRLIYYEAYLERKDAIGRERFLKKWFWLEIY
jgi:putative endonuclease